MRHGRLPEPGDWRQFCILMARYHSRPIAMQRPPWEMYVVEGLDNIEGFPPGSYAIAIKVHHAAVDGASAMKFFGSLCDIDAEGTPHNAVEKDHQRTLTTIVGDVVVRRKAYRHDGCPNLYPADAQLNLPQEQFSLGLRQRAAIEAARGSFEAAQAAIHKSTGQHVGKRQVEELAQRAAQDFSDFYAQAPHQPTDSSDILALSVDGKGIVMRPEALRPATAKAAAESDKKLSTRLSKGEKTNRKRMAEVGVVYDATPVPRTPEDILRQNKPTKDPKPAPKAKNKWLIASVVEDAAAVISHVFEKASRRDPDHQCTWVALVDGNKHQIKRIQAEAESRSVDVHIIVDFIHVLELC
jgi:hypothetical protein